ncbi:S-layer homology domain-containing protein [Desulfolucanica intricata]|uniref:S-layer homology domain-containing protein n=1 Tax=Desulfolucanica intricata TaxID=1285191 RepID=UPI00082EE083|nr:S-layer homology domain-containing protein [Desulfolucanica intricata]
MAMKKGLVALAGAATLFVGATAASAGVGDDVKGTKYEEPINKLAALGIATGYEDGSIQPEKTITRAEFAAIVVRELNLGDNFTAADTKFTDVSADSHWAGGYINVAVGQGILKGYPDGTFKPDAPVTYAEAATMLVRMLGYSPAVDENNWPASYISRAASIGITNGVRVSANDAALRGDVMMMAANSLDANIMKQVGWGTEVRYEVMDGSNGNKEESILTEYWDIDVYDDKDEYLTVTGVARTDISGLEPDEITFDGPDGKAHGGTYDVVEYFNPNDFLGEEVEAWIDEDDDIVYYIATSSNQSVVIDTFDKFQDNKTNIKLNNGDDYDIDDDAVIYYNLNKETGFSKWVKDNNIGDDALVKLVLNNKNDVVAMVVTDIYADGNRGIAEEVNLSKETISFMDNSGSTSSLKMDGDDYLVVRDGMVASLEDIEEGDVINWLEDGDDYYVIATSTKVEGTVDDVKYTKSDVVSSYDLVVDGVTYDVANKATFSENGNEDIDEVETDDLDEMEGEDVTLYLDAAGNIAHIVTGELDSTAGQVAVVTKNVRWLVQDEEWELTLVNEQGKEVEYRFEADDIDINGEERDDQYILNNLTINKNVNPQSEDILPGVKYNDDDFVDRSAHNFIAVEYSLDKNGNLKSIDILDDASNKKDYKVIAGEDKIEFDEYDDNIYFDGFGTYKVTRNTVIFDVTDAANNGFNDGELDDVDVVAWDDIKDKEDIDKAAVQIKSNGRDIEFLFILDSENLTSKGEYGFVTGFKSVGRDDAIRLVGLDGEERTLVYDNKSDFESQIGDDVEIAKGAFIRYELDSDGEIDEAQILAFATTDEKDGVFTSEKDRDTLDSWSIEKISGGVVQKSSTSSIVVKESKDADPTNIVVNSNTVYFDLSDVDDMDIVTGVSDGDLIFAVDTDDDGNAADFVVIISEDYKWNGTTPPGGGGGDIGGDTVTYIAKSYTSAFGRLTLEDVNTDTSYKTIDSFDDVYFNDVKVSKAFMKAWLATYDYGDELVVKITEDNELIVDAEPAELTWGIEAQDFGFNNGAGSAGAKLTGGAVFEDVESFEVKWFDADGNLLLTGELNLDNTELDLDAALISMPFNPEFDYEGDGFWTVKWAADEKEGVPTKAVFTVKFITGLSATIDNTDN